MEYNLLNHWSIHKHSAFYKEEPIIIPHIFPEEIPVCLPQLLTDFTIKVEQIYVDKSGCFPQTCGPAGVTPLSPSCHHSSRWVTCRKQCLLPNSLYQGASKLQRTGSACHQAIEVHLISFTWASAEQRGEEIQKELSSGMGQLKEDASTLLRPALVPWHHPWVSPLDYKRACH